MARDGCEIAHPVVEQPPRPAVRRARATVVQWQLSSTPRVRTTALVPARADRPAPSFSAAPWVDHDPGLPRRQRREALLDGGHDACDRRRRRSRRRARRASRSPSPTPSAIHGNRSTASAQVSPCRSPTANSRSRGSASTVEPAGRRRRAPRSARPGPGRRTTAAAGRSAATSGAAACAWAWPTSSSGTSACPWARPVWFHAVRPCRSRTSRVAARRQPPSRRRLPRRPLVTVSGSSISGQSRHSRSRA